MGQLADRLANFIVTIDRATGGRLVEPDHLRFPVGGPRTFVGSEFGAQMWATEQGSALLDLVAKDAQVLESFAGNWDPPGESRMILTSAVSAWQGTRCDPLAFAQSVEPALWESLRREQTAARAVAIVEGIQAPPGNLILPYGTAIIQPNDQLLEESFAGVWPNYGIRLPAGPYALMMDRVLVPRRYFGGIAAPGFAYIGLMQLREAIWLATGTWVRIGHVAASEEHAFPVSPPEHYPPEPYSEMPRAEIGLEGQQGNLTGVVLRLGVLRGQADETEPERFGSVSETGITLRTLSSQADAATHSADAITPLLAAFSLAEGSLTEHGEPSDVVPRRYAILCAANDEEGRRLRGVIKALDPIRDAIVHGTRPSNEEIRRFLGDDSAGDGQNNAAWFPVGWDRSGSAARARALELLRRLFRAWLFMTVDVEEGSVKPGLSREEVLTLIKEAARGSASAVARIRSIVSGEGEAKGLASGG